MALLGLYVGVIPILLGMLWLPWIRGIPPARCACSWRSRSACWRSWRSTRRSRASTSRPRARRPSAATALVLIGALVAFLILSGVGAWLSDAAAMRGEGGAAIAAGAPLALLVAIGIGLHNLGEGLAIGTSFATGALALGAFLVVGFAIHNTTEGLAIVAPVAQRPPSFGRLAGSGCIAGLPAVLGAWIGALAFNASLAAFLFGLGAGAIVQVIVQLAPTVRDEQGRLLHPLAVGGALAGIALMFVTGLLVTI